MKHLLKAVVAVTLSLAMSVPALAVNLYASDGKTAIVSGDLVKNQQADYAISVYIHSDGDNFTYGAPVLYTYGPTTAGNTVETGGKRAEIAILPQKVDKNGKMVSDKYKITSLEAREMTENVEAEVELFDGTTEGGRKAPVVTLRAKSGAEDCELSEYKVRLSMEIGEISGIKIINKQTVKVTIKGQAAYAQSRDVESDDGYRITENSGSVFCFDNEIFEPTRITCQEDLDLYFEGYYGQNYKNLRVENEVPAKVEEKFRDTYVKVYDFIAKPAFEREVEVRFQLPEDAYIYLYDDQKDTYTRVSAAVEGEKMVFYTKQLGCYVVSDKLL